MQTFVPRLVIKIRKTLQIYVKHLPFSKFFCNFFHFFCKDNTKLTFVFLERIKKCKFFCINICVYQKYFVILHPETDKMHRNLSRVADK